MPDPRPELVFIDTETTGLDPVADRIIELGAVRLGPDLRERERFSSLIDPGRRLPLFVQRLTGIEGAALAGAPRFAEAYGAFRDYVGDAVVGGQNIAFDLSLLAAEARRAGLPTLANETFDTLEAALLLYPELDRHALALMAAHLGLDGGGHRAAEDAACTAQLFAALCRRAAGLAAPERQLLAAAAWSPLRLLDRFAAAPDAAPPPMVADEPPAREASLGALPVAEGDWRAELDVSTQGAGDATGDAAQGEAGGLAARLAGFRRRPGQVDLAADVAGVLERGGIAVFEAGTGMGKSLAYLLPAAFHSAARGRRLVVSTKTKALQRQLAAHELPLVAAALPPGWRWAVLMGRENYLCRRQLEDTLREAADHLPERDHALALAYLVGRTRRGEVDLSALPFRATLVLPALAELARSLRSSGSACLGRRCPARTRCHWRLARARAERAHLVCVNHALLLTGGTSLPPHDDVIVDEAHLLPDEAMSAFSDVVDWTIVERLLGDLRGRHKQRPLAQRVRAAAATAETGQARALLAAGERLEGLALSLPGLAADLGETLTLLAAAARGDESGDGGYGVSVRLTPGLREQPTWDAFAGACAALAEGLAAVAGACAAAHEALPEEHRDSTVTLALSEEAGTAAAVLGDLPETQGADHVAWGEIEAARGRGGFAAAAQRRLLAEPGRWRLTRAPITPAAQLRETLWERLRSAVLTSATLTVAGSFSYYREMAGLAADLEVRERVFASPFDYRRQAVLVLERDQTPFVAGEQAARQAERLKRLTEVTGGRLLALFTNKRDMQQVAAVVGEHAEQDGVVLLAQGLHGSAASLAEEFRSHPATVLLGVDSLWTGQDFPGDTLVCLVIAKLPFGRQDPLFQARRQAAEEAGRDWFRTFYLPEAVLKFRQGFGRLIRTETDTGVIVVLDQRLSQKGYQREFLASLPDLPIVWASPEELGDVVAGHLERLAPQAADTP